MKKVYLLKGLPACGKTTWAKKMMATYPGQFKRVNKDDIRAMLDDGKWSPTNEKFVLQIRDQLITATLDAGKHVIVDDTNLVSKHEKHIADLIRGKAILIVVDLTSVDVEECVQRDANRPNSVGASVIREMHQKHIQNAYTVKPMAYNPALSDAMIVDIDGTLAKMNGRGAFEWDRVDEDLLNEPVAEVVSKLQDAGWRLILVSGRDAVCREKTEAWLKKNGIADYHSLLMRKQGDNRKDYIVKKEIYEQIRDCFNIMVVLDDRNQTVNMWRQQGLTCFQVADGNF